MKTSPCHVCGVAVPYTTRKHKTCPEHRTKHRTDSRASQRALRKPGGVTPWNPAWPSFWVDVPRSVFGDLPGDLEAVFDGGSLVIACASPDEAEALLDLIEDVEAERERQALRIDPRIGVPTESLLTPENVSTPPRPAASGGVAWRVPKEAVTYDEWVALGRPSSAPVGRSPRDRKESRAEVFTRRESDGLHEVGERDALDAMPRLPRGERIPRRKPWNPTPEHFAWHEADARRHGVLGEPVAVSRPLRHPE